MTTEERGNSLPPITFFLSFIGSTKDPDATDGSSFRNWYEYYLFRYGREDDLPPLGSDEH
jgi:hypothetical protein